MLQIHGSAQLRADGHFLWQHKTLIINMVGFCQRIFNDLYADQRADYMVNAVARKYPTGKSPAYPEILLSKVLTIIIWNLQSIHCIFVSTYSNKIGDRTKSEHQSQWD